MTNHLDLVQQLHAAQPPEKTIEGCFAFVLRLLARLPRDEQAGLLRKDAGANIVFYKGITVSAGRICYPNGDIVKVLTDIPTTLDPSWQTDVVSPALYVAYVPDPIVEPDEPDPIVEPLPDPFLALHAKLDALKVQSDANTEKIQAQIDQAIKNAEASAKAYLPLLAKLERFL
jgi:hypothetical protein